MIARVLKWRLVSALAGGLVLGWFAFAPCPRLSAQESATPATSASERLVLLDGSSLPATVTGITSAGLVQIADQDALPLAALRQISRAQPIAPVEPNLAGGSPVVVELQGGARLVATELGMDDEACRVRWAYGEKLLLAIDAVRAVRFSLDKSDPDFEAALAGEGEEVDRIFFQLDEKLEVVRGLIERLDDREIVFEYQGKQSRLPREKLFGVIVATVGDASPAEDQCLVRMAGASNAGEPLGPPALWGTLQSLADGELKLAVAGETISLPWANVASITVKSDRITFLSDLKPVEVTQQPILAPARRWQADRSIAGQTLTLRKQAYEKGLGVSSYSKLVYELPGQHEIFAATLGIDDETAGAGDAVFVVVGDGRELFRLRSTGKDEPHPLRLDIAGIRRLELIVEPGEQLDLADHANWCDACLIRPEKTNGGK